MYRAIVPSLIALLVLTGCEAKRITGKAEDNFGKPVAGASVAIDGSGFKASTDPEGRFEIDYAPGDFNLVISAPGYLPFSQSLKLATHERYPMGPINLIRVPAADGLRIKGDQDYILVPEKPFATRHRVVDRYWNAACQDQLAPEGLPELEGDRLTAFVPPTPQNNWSLIRPKNGVLASIPLHMMASNCMFSGTNKVEIAWKKVPDGLWSLSGELEPGTYCLVRVNDGMFAASIGSSGACFRWKRHQANGRAITGAAVRGGVKGASGSGQDSAAKMGQASAVGE